MFYSDKTVTVQNQSSEQETIRGLGECQYFRHSV